MKRTFLSMMLGATALAALPSCDSSETGSGTAQPYRDEWREVINQPFIVLNDDGTVAISELNVGTASGDNFRNRGDVIVKYADTDRIIVEMRKFTMVESEESAQADFDKLSIWASNATLPPPPFDLDEEDNCLDEAGQKPWQDGCRIVVFYDGQTQVERSGADLRITLPRNFIYDLNITTDDNDVDADYQNRGNVCVEGLPGSADISLSNGSAWVILDESMPEMPECPDDLRAECESAEINWGPECGCTAQGYSFSQVKIASNDGQSANAIVDIPGTGNFWASYNLRNDGENSPGDDSPGASCEGVVEDSTGTVRLSENTDLNQKPSSNQGSINYPGEPATEGAGFSIIMNSDKCSVISATEDPADFAGVNLGSEQDSAERGNLRVCSGCARTMGCDALIPGL